MRWLWRTLMVLGAAAVALGLLWFLQGSDLIRIEPIACVADCEPITGHHPGWQVAGAVAVVIGSLATVASVRRLRAGATDPRMARSG